MDQLPDHTIIQNLLEVTEESVLKDPQLFHKLCAYINELIINDFERLVSLLYRIDVSEKKIKTFLQRQPGVNAAETIAVLIIERQLQKIKSRQENRREKTDIDLNESW
ncbi:MAG: hypothetical protein H7X88_10535 [Gloeobacteraceae cyanobacterium ES-bin-316]|nr:hypothetical protein [Ferruginibacter sp.]